MASLLSAAVLFYVHQQSDQIQTQLSRIQQDQFTIAQSTKTEEFDRDAERQYVALVYQDLISQNAEKQSAALSLVKILLPLTGGKLLNWAQAEGIILSVNRNKSQAIVTDLNAREENARFKLFVHLGKYGNRNVPEISEIRKNLADAGFGLIFPDALSEQYGPGVDYSHDEDKRGAEKVASILNQSRNPADKPISARKQPNVPPGYLGIWF